jgi:general secretion pathway protein K
MRRHGARSVAQQGIALIGVLWVLALLTISATVLSTTLREDLRLSANLVATAQARRAAEGGVELALSRLIAGPSKARELEVQVGMAAVRVTVVDEAGRLDLNEAPESMLAAYFRVLGLDEAQAAHVAHGILERRHVAAFHSIEELAVVPGMTTAVYRLARDGVSVHSGQLGVHAAAAPREVLLAIPGARPQEVEEFVALREAHRREGLPAPLVPPSLRHELSRAASAVYRIRAEALMPQGAKAGLTAIADLRRRSRDAPYTVREWRYE